VHSTVVHTRAGDIVVRPLRNGDTATVQAVFDGLGPQSRRRRFGYTKRHLKPDELEQLAAVGPTSHALVAWLDGEPVGIVRLVRDSRHAPSAEIAAAVVDGRQRRGIGTALLRLLVADALAAGITHIRATLPPGSNSLPMLTKATTIVSRRFVGGELEVVALTA
jgi:GNAT superfamily N-acetyltransferase